MATMLIAATLFTIAISGRRHTLMRRKAQKEVQRGAPLLDEEMCHNSEKLQICSHQILNAPTTSIVIGLLGQSSPPDGSKQAMESLWKAGIRCFDIDIVTLKDGILLAAHPTRFAAKVGERKPELYTLEKAREEGADEKRFPILEDTLEYFASLVKKDGEGAFFATETQINGTIPRLEGPLLTMDLKGPNLTTKHLQQIERIVEELGISGNVAICATALEGDEVGPGVDFLQTFNGDDSAEHEVQFGLVLRDRVEKDNDIEGIQSILAKYRRIKLVVASYRFDLDYFESISSFALPVAAWTVDDQEGLLHATKAGVSAVISNDPINLIRIHDRIRHRCQNY